MSAPEWITVKEAADLAGYYQNYIPKLGRVDISPNKARLGVLQLTKSGYFRQMSTRPNQNREAERRKRSGHDWWIGKSSLHAYIRAMKSLGNDRFNPHRNDD